MDQVQVAIGLGGAVLFMAFALMMSVLADLRTRYGLPSAEDSLGLLLMGFAGASVFLWSGVDSMHRLLRPGPAVRATADGLCFHPSIGPRFVCWSDVSAVDLYNPHYGPMHFRGTRLRVRVTRSRWLTWLRLGTRDISLRLLSLELTYKRGQQAVRELRAIKKAAAG